MDPSKPSARPSAISSLDSLVALMQDNSMLRQALLEATSSDQIQTILHRFGQPLAEGHDPVDPEQLRDAFRCD